MSEWVEQTDTDKVNPFSRIYDEFQQNFLQDLV